MEENKDYRDLLVMKPLDSKKNKLVIWMEWDSNDADYIEKTIEMKPESLFSNKKLIYCLAYISMTYDFKGGDWNDAVFEHYVPENEDIEDLVDILLDNDCIASTDWGLCHSCEQLTVTYWNEEGLAFDVTFENIYKKWKEMTYEEICQEINAIER